MLGRKKDKENLNNEPQSDNINSFDINELSDKHAKEVGKEQQFGRFQARRDATLLTKTRRRRRLIFWLTTLLIAFLFILWILAAVVSQWGDLVISLDREMDAAGITLCETSDFKKPEQLLKGTGVEDVTNITYNWLPDGLDKYVDKNNSKIDGGSHNGKNYLAYTFYIKNIGGKKVDYTTTLSISGVAKNVDEATRIEVYKNGKPTIYSKAKYKTKGKQEDDSKFITDGTPGKMFINKTDIMKLSTKDFSKGDVDKYTIVMWVEGNDPECVDAIMGGHLRMKMVFEATKTEEDSLVN